MRSLGTQKHFFFKQRLPKKFLYKTTFIELFQHSQNCFRNPRWSGHSKHSLKYPWLLIIFDALKFFWKSKHVEHFWHSKKSSKNSCLLSSCPVQIYGVPRWSSKIRNYCALWALQKFLQISLRIELPMTMKIPENNRAY